MNYSWIHDHNAMVVQENLLEHKQYYEFEELED